MRYSQLYPRTALLTLALLGELLSQSLVATAQSHETSLLSPRDLTGQHSINLSMYTEGAPKESRIPLAIGSGLVPIATVGDSTIVVALSDRGPNVGIEDPESGGPERVIFPKPDFNPVLAPLAIRNFGISPLTAAHQKSSPLKTRSGGPVSITDSTGTKVSGLPKESEHEVAVDSELKEIKTDTDSGLGIDSEAVTFDTRRGMLWVAEEYSPSIISVDPKSGRIVSIRRPGAGLPELLKNRAPNRGFEALTYTPSDHLVAILQSPLVNGELHKSEGFVRIISMPADAASPETPVTVAVSLPSDAQPSSYKIGDVVALSNSRFLALEAYQSKDDEKHYHLILLDIEKAQEIDSERFLMDSAELKSPVRKKIVLDFKDFNWASGKIEGLATVNERTLLISKDNDFGIKLKKKSKKKPLPPQVVFEDIPTEFLILEFKEPLTELLSGK